MTDVLEEFAAIGPDAIFFPLFVTEGSAFAAQARTFDGLEGTTLISAAALLVSAFLGTPESGGDLLRRTGIGLSLQRQRADGKERGAGSRRVRGQARQFSPVTVLGARLRCDHHPPLGHRNPLRWRRATGCFIDRAALREKVGATAMNGLVGAISCDEFGDCGTGRMNIYHHMDTSITDVSKLPVVYVYNR